MLHRPNTYRDDLNPMFGVPQIAPQPGETFDQNNDLLLGEDGWTVYHRDGHITYHGHADALVEYNRRHMHPDAYAEFYADDDEPIEYMMLHGCD